jgi:hypothetical protein
MALMESDMIGEQVEKEYVTSLLHDGVVTVKFTKKDGSDREMRCTLKEDLIPSEMKPKGSGKAKSSDSIAVFDVDVVGWRSFRFDSVKELNFSV